MASAATIQVQVLLYQDYGSFFLLFSESPVKKILKGALYIGSETLKAMAEEYEKNDREAGDERTVNYWLNQKKWVVYQCESYVDYDEDPIGLIKEKIIFKGAYDTKEEAKRNASVYDTIK